MKCVYRLQLLLALLALAACEDTAPGSVSRLSATGEVIAYGGGAGGATRSCVVCHGLRGEGDSNLSPRLAGLDRGYLQRQLEDYASGRRRHEAMGEIARRLPPDERAKVSRYYAGLALTVAGEEADVPILGQSLYLEGDAERGLQACAACHGADGEGIGAANPPLAGQPAPYLAAQLEAWQRGDRRSDPNHVMAEISLHLSASEIAAVSDYASSLQGAAHRQAGSAASP